VTAKSLFVLAETSLEDLIHQAETTRPNLLIVDSVQTVYSTEIASSPGSVSQLRAVTGALVSFAKRSGTPLLVVGHVTKDGSIAGPKLLEHMVDTVLYFEGSGGGPFRIVRAVKNRFGSTNEIGVFEMRECGLVEVPNPSGMFLAERPERAPGSVVVCTLEGTRPLLAEIQALVTPNNFGPPRVTAIGAETGRVLLMLNILQKRGGLDVLGCDVFVNVIGGVRIVEPAADLAIIAALASSFWDRPARPGTVLFGEVGLTGEVRSVSSPAQRVGEVVKLGFENCVMPKGNVDTMTRDGGQTRALNMIPVTAVPDALAALLPQKDRR
jgi:DNA repair protein RadA/Sms